eukprot:TRINITY_DN91525_c0_g1_i1.p1 TRINITY_DN91525_c0_g1~~TRINITY_DN91525_c0_g1_i1.p1  ORF type:complete len:405 (+),score=51.04 TRINITY_DN91525_c0_g1_i1:112-1215(+)
MSSVEALLGYNASVHLRCPENRTAAMYVMHFDREDVSGVGRLLLAHGAANYAGVQFSPERDARGPTGALPSGARSSNDLLVAAGKSEITPDGKQLTLAGTPVPPTHWGIALHQIDKFWSECREDADWSSDMSVRELDKLIIRKNYSRGRGVALSMNDSSPLQINALVSHCWDENTSRFFRDVCTWLNTMKQDEEDSLFICFLSNYQGTPEEIKRQVEQGSDRIEDGVFAAVLNNVSLLKGRMYVVPCNEVMHCGGLYGRLWCTWEVCNAAASSLPIIFHPDYDIEHYFGSASQLSRVGDLPMGFSSKNGRCGNPRAEVTEDEKRIREAITAGYGWDNIDCILRACHQFTSSKPCQHFFQTNDFRVLD